MTGAGGGRGGWRARLPEQGWEPVARWPADGEGLVVRFVEEAGGRCRLFDFSRLPVEAGVARWLAAAFARRTGPRSGVKRLRSAQAIYEVCRLLGKVLAEAGPAVSGPEQVTGAHIKAFMMRHAGMSSGRTDLIELRALPREDPRLPEQTRAVLLAGRVPDTQAADRCPVLGYDDRQWHLIMTALRGDLRAARDRIRVGRAVLDRYRAGLLPAGSEQAVLGAVLDVFERTGDVPRYADGSASRAGLAGRRRGRGRRAAMPDGRGDGRVRAAADRVDRGELRHRRGLAGGGLPA